ncbi:MAG: ABC transporter substrate-binding protein [Coriobacteriales bacterium]|nr:ABC transporter substrate-binding protein [Coriobacteriales bacterium]
MSPLDEPDTTDFQCTTIHYTIALNVFDRLVEEWVGRNGEASIVPSLAQSWEVSDDGLLYTFHLRKDVTFSNGFPLTAQDVRYTFTRLLTHPHASNQDIAGEIVGAKALQSGEAKELEGFTVLDDYNFTIKLEHPYSAFLACLSMPGASILDEETTTKAGDSFGTDPASTVGTGPFVFQEWRPGDRILLAANPTWWEGTPNCKGVDLRFVYDAEKLNEMYRNGEFDIINMDDLGDLGDFYLHGSEYKDLVKTAPHVGIDYIALNSSIAPLNDARVRQALQRSLNREVLLDACLRGSGQVENGIFPHGLVGFNPNLPTIPYDLQGAKKLLEEAGLANGFDLEIGMRPSSTSWQRTLMEMAATMWEKIGVRATIKILSEDEFMDQRTSGKLACYTASWAADFNDPDNFAYTFFGSAENTKGRSLCYDNNQAIERVSAARYITDEAARLKEYNDLEKLIVQDDAAWIPLFSRERHFLTSSRLENFTTAWNGWFETYFKYMSISE